MSVFNDSFGETCVNFYRIPFFNSTLISWDDALMVLYILTSTILVILSSVGSIKKDITEKETLDLVQSQKILHLFLGILTIVFGVYNIYMHGSSSYSISNRLIIGCSKLVMGIVFIVITVWTYNQKPTLAI